jgi:hypothetical protein
VSNEDRATKIVEDAAARYMKALAVFPISDDSRRLLRCFAEALLDHLGTRAPEPKPTQRDTDRHIDAMAALDELRLGPLDEEKRHILADAVAAALKSPAPDALARLRGEVVAMGNVDRNPEWRDALLAVLRVIDGMNPPDPEREARLREMVTTNRRNGFHVEGGWRLLDETIDLRDALTLAIADAGRAK